MKDKNISIPISFAVNKEVSDKDNRFISVTIDVLHTGLNFNKSIFSKEVVDANIDTIKNTPILGFITEAPYDDKDFKGHEYVITKDENGIKRKYIGEAFGLIPESCNPRWITKETDSGVEREFLQVDGILWTKFQDAADIMLNDIEKPQSMELYPYDIDGYEDDDGNFVFSKFSFDGCCILGDEEMYDGNGLKSSIELRNIQVVNKGWHYYSIDPSDQTIEVIFRMRGYMVRREEQFLVTVESEGTFVIEDKCYRGNVRLCL